MRYKLFGNSGLRVSELCLGSMAFGESTVWGCDKKEAEKIVEAYTSKGGNFIDTSNIYGLGNSEKIIGELVKPNRDDFVLATKYSFIDTKSGINYAGNHRKNLMRSVEGSLKRLATNYIDLLWVHCPDGVTPIAEIMRGLDDLVRMGKVHYIGISNAPAWQVAQANTMAELKGWICFTGIQPEYNLLQRTPERELFPMAKALDMAITPWSPMGGGVLTGKYLKNEGKRVPKDSYKFSDKNIEITKTLVAIAKKLGYEPGQVALRWAMQKSQVVIPIVGARKLSHIQSSLKCVDFVLPDSVIKQLDDVSAIEMGYPHDFLQMDMVRKHSFAGTLDQIDNHRKK